MNEIMICDIWSLFSQYIDRKVLPEVAELFVEYLSELGVEDDTLRASLGTNKHLDKAIDEYFDESAGD